MTKRFIPILLLGLMFQGCADKVSSTDVSVADISAEINVTSEDNHNAYIEVQLRKGDTNSNEFLSLEGGDRLIASTQPDFTGIHIGHDLFNDVSDLSEEYKEMAEGSDTITIPFLFFPLFDLQFLGTGGIWYFTTFTNISSNTEFTIAFIRDGKSGAPDSTVRLPDAFEITEPLNGSATVYSRQLDTVSVQWTPSGTAFSMTLETDMNCDDGTKDHKSTGLTGDTGSYILTLGSLGNFSGACRASLNIRRSGLGQLDSNYGKGGSILGHQSRTVVINTSD
jgi:hypothetical protein